MLGFSFGSILGVTFSAITFWKSATQGAISVALRNSSKEVVKKISCEIAAIGAKLAKEGVTEGTKKVRNRFIPDADAILNSYSL